MIGHEESKSFGDDHVENCWWIGKPWRRLELLVNDHYYKGERVERTFDISINLGNRRIGWNLHVAVAHAPALDYSDEAHQ